MKKKSVAAMLLALSFTMGAATMTGCNLKFGDGTNTDTPGITDPEKPSTVAVTGVSIGDSSAELTVGGTKPLQATVAPENATNKKVSWSSNYPSIASVDQNGLVTAVAEGTAIITVTTEDGGKTAICAVKVNKADTPAPPVDPTPTEVSVTGVNISKTAATLETGEKESLTATVLPDNATNKKVSWSSDNTAAATVNNNGVVTAVAAGTAKITVTTEDGNKTAVCTVTVKAAQPPVDPTPTEIAVTGVNISKTAATLEIGDSENLTATVLPDNATNKNVSWSSNNTAAAIVNNNGVVTAVAAGTAVITVTTEDGNKTATCTITVNAPVVEPDPAEVYEVKFYNGGILVSTKNVEEGNTVSAPTGLTKDGYYLSGWTTSEASGALYDFTAPVTGALSLYAQWEKLAEGLNYTYAGNENAAFEWQDGDYSSATVRYKLSTASAYSTVDAALVRAAKTDGTARVDVVGLKGGANYDFEITTSAGKKLTVNNMTITAYDRAGYAHFGATEAVGAYNNDGTPKDNAVIVYVTEATKNTVTAKIGGKTYTGIVSILQNAGTSTPLIVRVIGTVGAATWNKLEENGGKALTPDKVVGRNGKSLVDYYNIQRSTYNASADKYEGGTSKDLTQKTLIADGFNTLDTSVYAELKGLNSKAKYDASKDEFDSAWNDCQISGVKNVTVEGIGEDARIFQWGFTFKSCDSIEVRNLTFEDYTEDACSFESGETSVKDLSGFKHGNVWLHHNTFEEGVNYWDVCNEQDKHDGDGSTDFKGIRNITLSYNVYNGTHKTGLIGGSDSQTTANVTFHHNAYNNCNSRMPLGRQANMHMYNNYYNGSTGTNMSLRGNAYALIENCYFDNANNPIEIKSGVAKVVGSVFNGKKPASNANLHLNADRGAKYDNGNKFGQYFDTDSSLFYCKTVDGKIVTDVDNMLTAEQVKEIIPKIAGVQKRGGDVTLGGSTGGSTGGDSGGEGGGNEGGDEVVSSTVTLDPSNLTVGAITADSPVTSGVFTLVGGSNFAVAANEVTFTYNGKEYTTANRISLGGSANFSSSRYIEFTVSKACKITVAAMSSKSLDDRTLNLVKEGSTTAVTTFAANGSGVTVTSYDCAESGTYRLGSSNSGIHVYYIIIEYSE